MSVCTYLKATKTSCDVTTSALFIFTKKNGFSFTTGKICEENSWISECKDVRLKDMPARSETHGLLFSSHAPLECDIHSVERCECKVLGPKLSPLQ